MLPVLPLPRLTGAVAAPLSEGTLPADWVAPRDEVAAAKEVTEAELEVETVTLSDKLGIALALAVLLNLPLLLLEAEPVPNCVALALATFAAEDELTGLKEAPDEELPVARAEAVPVNVLGAEPVWEGLEVAVLLLRSPLLVGVRLLLGAGETLGMVDPVTKPCRLILPVGLEVADALSQKLSLLRSVKEAEAVGKGEVEGLEEKDCADVNVLTALLVLVALAQPVTLGVAEALAVSEAEVVSVAEAEELGKEEGESRWLRELVLLA